MAKLNLSRDQLASFLKTHEQIKQFEQLFNTVDTVSTSIYDELLVNAGTAVGVSLSNQAQIIALEQSLRNDLADIEAKINSLPQPNQINTDPAPISSNSQVLDYLDFNGIAPHVSSPRRLSWNPVDETLDLGLPNSVTLQLGQEMYARVRNISGATITNGSVVNIIGGSSMTLHIEPFIADGSHLNVAFLGVMTHDIADGAAGYCTVWGNVRELDTTAFTTGDVLYASPTVLGGFTNVKPTAPNNVIPVAFVTSVGTLGSVFVKPVIEQNKYYGRFEKTVDQSPTVINTAEVIPINNTIEANGVTITSGSRITFANSGVYSIAVNFQITSGSSSQKNLWLWYRRNGVDVAGSSIINTTVTNGASQTVSRTNFFNINANDYIELYMAADSVNITLDASPATAFAPSSPAVRINVIQIQH